MTIHTVWNVHAHRSSVLLLNLNRYSLRRCEIAEKNKVSQNDHYLLLANILYKI